MEKNKNKRKKSLKKLLKYKTFRKRNIISLLSIITSIILIIFLFIMNIFPIKYIILITILILGINCLGTIFMNIHKKTPIKIIGTIIIILSLIGNCIGIYYISNTNNFMNKSFNKKILYNKNTYYVLSLKSNNLKESDITGTIATYKETVNLAEAIKQLNQKYSLKEIEYDDLGTVFDQINNNTNKIMLIEKSSYEIVFSISEVLNKSDYDILYEFDLYTKKKSSNNNLDKYNVFVGGTDFAGLMDFNMIATINTKTREVLLTSIPRDYYIEVAGKNGRYDKLSFMNAYGNNVNKESLEKLFDTNIDYSIILNTNSLVNIVDYVGGIDFCSDYTFTTSHALVTDTYNDKGKKLYVKKGCQHLNGVETLTVARERNAFPGRDRVRQQNCQKILISIVKKLISTDTLLHYSETLNTINNTYETDITKKMISSIIKDTLENPNKWKITTQSVNGEDGHDKVHMTDLIDWVMYPDYNTVNSAKKQINDTLK